MDPFISQLKDLCRAHPTRAKWVFVPSHAIGLTLGDRLVLEGTDWANLRFVTPFDIALRMGAPFLVERGIDPSEEGLGPALVMRLLLGLPDSHTYFRPLAHQPEMASALWKTLTELRMAGVRTEQIKAGAFQSAAKHSELLALVTAYESFLAQHKRGDRATVFDEALRHLDWCPIQPQDCWLELPDAAWPQLARRLMDALPGERITPATLALPCSATPRRLAKDARVSPIEPGAEAPLAFLLAPDKVEKGKGPSVEMFTAGGAEAEIEEVFRRILASGLSLDEVEIACAQPTTAALVWEKALRYDWPVTIGQGIPAAMTRPGRALVAYAEWIDDDFAAGHLRKMLQSGDVDLPKNGTIRAGRAARLLVKAQAAWGRDTYRLALGRLARSWRTRADRDDIPADEREGLLGRAAEADELASWIDGIIRQVPKPGADGRVDLQSLVTGAERFVQQTATRMSALDAAAATMLAGALGELRALGDFHCTLAQALRFLTERVQSVHIGADRPRPGHLHVSSLAPAGYANRRLVFVIGLEEGRVFPGAFEDPILLDEERAAIESSLVRSVDRIDEAVHAAIGRLAAISARPDTRLCLSYSCRDLREFRTTYASWLLLQAYRVVSGKPAASYRDLHEHLGAPKSCVPDAAGASLGPSRWWLRGLVDAGPAGRGAVLQLYKTLDAGVRAETARASAQFTEFDGLVPAAGPILDPVVTRRIVSPTDLEKAASCPFKYFLERGLNVYAIESGERDRDLWLNPLLRGSLLHDLYAALMRRARQEKRKVSVALDQKWLDDQGREALADLAREMPSPSDEIQEREAEEFLADLALFVDEEAEAAHACEPVGFEVSFGRHGTDEEPLAHADPIEVSIGGGRTIRLAGRIDRIDQLLGDEHRKGMAFEIIDYKTGTYYAPNWEGTFAGGTRLQHALYGLAATELLKRQGRQGRIARATYYFSSTKGKQTRKRIDAQPLARTEQVLSDLREVIAGGRFVHAADKESCKYCDYGHACGRGAFARAAAKLADPALATFVRLTEHE